MTEDDDGQGSVEQGQGQGQGEWQVAGESNDDDSGEDDESGEMSEVESVADSIKEDLPETLGDIFKNKEVVTSTPKE